MKTIIRNARVLTFDANDTQFDCANILIDSPNIVSVGPGLEFPAGSGNVTEIDAAGKLAIPGLINGHFHSPANLMKGSLPSLPLEVFMLYEVPPFSEQPLSPRLIYIRTLLGAIDMLKQGVTSLQDDAFFVPYPDTDSIDALMTAYGDVGIRATAALDQSNIVEYDKQPFLKDLLPATARAEMDATPVMSVAELTDLYRHLIDTWDGACNGRLRAAVSCSAPQRVTQEYFGVLSELSSTHKLPFYIHTLETKLQRVFGEQRYGKSLVQYVNDLGFLDQRVNLIHGIWIDDSDMKTIANAGAIIAHNPVCNLRLGSGVMPFRRIREYGIPICIGTDEALADDSTNVWAAAKMAGLIHNITDPDYTRWPQADEVLDCLFHGGARAMGLADQLGCIAPGYAADIALLDLNTSALTPLNDINRQLVYCENGSSVWLTMVAGEVVMRDGRVLTVDEDEIYREARELMEAHQPVLKQAAQAAAKLEPHYRDMYLRGAAIDVGINRWANHDKKT